MIKKFPRHICGGENGLDGEQMRCGERSPSLCDVGASFSLFSLCATAGALKNITSRASGHGPLLRLNDPRVLFATRRVCLFIYPGAPSESESTAGVNDVWVLEGVHSRV
jgi:hypothetical protein